MATLQYCRVMWYSIWYLPSKFNKRFYSRHVFYNSSIICLKSFIFDHIEPAKATDSMISPLFVRSDVRMFVCNEMISETAPTIFLKLSMKLGGKKFESIFLLDNTFNFPI